MSRRKLSKDPRYADRRRRVKKLNEIKGRQLSPVQDIGKGSIVSNLSMKSTPCKGDFANGGYVRVFGPDPLSDIECRVLDIEPTGLHFGGPVGGWLYATRCRK